MSISSVHAAAVLVEDFFEKTEIFFCGPASSDLVEKAQLSLRVKFPLSYQEFLLKYGYGGVNSLDVDGITDYVVPGSDCGGIVWSTKEKRKTTGFPHHIIPISDMGDGSSYALDLSQMDAENECPVVIWPLNGYEDTPVLEIVAKDFGEFFLNKVKEQIAMKNE